MMRVHTLFARFARSTTRPRRRVLITLVALAVASTGMLQPTVAATGSGTIRGRVTDAATGAGLLAVVTAVTSAGSLAAQTDSAGYYRLQAAAGSVTLTASRQGYADLTRSGTLSSGETATVNFALRRLTSATPTPTPRPTATATPGPGPSGAPTFRLWSDPRRWPNGRVPTRSDNVVIAAGDGVEVDTTTAEARTLTVRGTLRASRQRASQLTVYGNLLLMDRGVLDYGRPNDRVEVSAVIRWVLNEANYVGGDTMTPVASDVGLWAMGDAQVWVHGLYRDTWSPLLQPARAGAVDIVVDRVYAAGWQAGDEVVVGPSHLKASAGDNQDEVRRIVAVLGNGLFRLNAPLQFTHDVLRVNWTDAWGDDWTEGLAAKVINLTANVRFQAADANHRPHVMFMERAKHFVEDLAVQNFSPMPRRDPMSRYAWHEHQQRDGSRGSYLRRVRLYGGPGEGWHIHESYGIEGQDVVIYNQARARVVRGSSTITNTNPFVLERTRAGSSSNTQNHAADDCWVDRLLVMRWGVDLHDHRNSGIWLSGALNCAIVGAVAAGGGGQSRSSGMHWEEGGAAGGETAFVYRAEAQSNQVMGFHSWQNATPAQRIVDLLAWRNGNAGIGWGAYGTRYWAHQVRAIGNGQVQLAHWATNWGITGFLADGLGRGAGIEVRNYAADSTSDSVYEDGVVRNVQTNARHLNSNEAGQMSWIQYARVNWDPDAPILFGQSAVPPPGSRFRIRAQTGLPRPANFTLYRLNDSTLRVSSVRDALFNAQRVDGDTTGTRPRPPRVLMVTPDDQVVSGTVRLEVETNASEVEFYQANHLLGRVAVVGGRASFSFNMGNFPYRRAYFWAQVEGGNGAVNTSRVIRVRRF